MPAGIEAVATYLPPARLPLADLRRHWPGVGAPGGVESVAVAGYDEDVVTMGSEAADAVLAGAGVGTDAVDLVIVATCSSPYAEHSAAAEVARALGLAPTVALVDHAGSTLGGVNALLAAGDAVASGRSTRALVVAAEQRRGRPGTSVEALGAGAVALLVSAGGPVTLDGSASSRHGVPTRWRPDGASALRHYDDARYELMGQVLPAASAVLGQLELPHGGFVAVGPLDVRSRTALLRATPGAAADDSFEVSATGDLGTAGPLFALAGHLGAATAAGGICVAIEPGSGAVGVAVTARAAVPVVEERPTTTVIDYVGYLQRFGVLEGSAPPEPIVPHAATPGAARDDAEGSLTGGRCLTCHSLHVPVRRVCTDCGGSTFRQERAPRLGTVVTVNIQHVVAVHPEPAPVAVGVIRLSGEGGARGGQVSAMFTDSDLTALGVGSTVRLVYRRLGVDDGLVKYGWKARLVNRSDVDDTRGDRGAEGTERVPDTGAVPA